MRKLKSLKGNYVEARITNSVAPGYHNIEVMDEQSMNWEILTDKKGVRLMVRNRMHCLNTMDSVGYEFLDFANKFKGMPTYLLKKSY